MSKKAAKKPTKELANAPVDIFADYDKPPDQEWSIPTDPERGVYRFITAASKRARQLQGGARPTISTTSRKPTKIAMHEIRDGAIEVTILDPEEMEEAAASKPKPTLD